MVKPLLASSGIMMAAATQVAMATAWELVVTKGKVRQGEDVLVNAAGGGVGSAAVQIAHLAGLIKGWAGTVTEERAGKHVANLHLNRTPVSVRST